METIKINKVAVVMLLILLGVFMSIVYTMPEKSVASVERTGEYNSTTTNNGLWNSSSENISSTTLQTENGTRSVQGTFGSIIITGSNAGVINVYDATTSDATKRSANFASTSIMIASLPANAATGTYTFDVRYVRGLIVQVVSPAPTSTITWRD